MGEIFLYEVEDDRNTLILLSYWYKCHFKVLLRLGNQHTGYITSLQVLRKFCQYIHYNKQTWAL